VDFICDIQMLESTESAIYKTQLPSEDYANKYTCLHPLLNNPLSQK